MYGAPEQYYSALISRLGESILTVHMKGPSTNIYGVRSM